MDFPTLSICGIESYPEVSKEWWPWKSKKVVQNLTGLISSECFVLTSRLFSRHWRLGLGRLVSFSVLTSWSWDTHVSISVSSTTAQRLISPMASIRIILIALWKHINWILKTFWGFTFAPSTGGGGHTPRPWCFVQNLAVSGPIWMRFFCDIVGESSCYEIPLSPGQKLLPVFTMTSYTDILWSNATSN